MQFWLNGEARTWEGDGELPLLTWLRRDEGIISPKDGCAPQAACGCCVVQVDERALLACVTPMRKVVGTRVTTTEGLDPYRQRVFANAFVAKGGVQCGFCIPGIVMQANVLLQANPEPTGDQIEQALTPHLCRCTGYKKIVEAIQCAAEALRAEEEVPLPESDGRVGARLPKYGAAALVLGQHRYVDDIRVEGMAYGALRWSDHPRARVLRVDTAEAEAMAGVLRVFTAKDVPGTRHVGLIRQDWPLIVAEGETTRYTGDVLAGVVAETEEAARAAAQRVRVEYEVLEPVTDPHAALLPDSPQVDPGGNVLARTVARRGEPDGAEATSAFVARGTFQTQRIEHAFMEPECAIAYPSGEGGVELLSQSQGVYDDRKQVARLLGLPEGQVRVTLVPNGGGFGGKEDLSVQGHAALFAHLLGRPVKVRLTRDESIGMHPKRHPIWMEYAIGCDAAGRFTFCRARFVGDSGAYASVGMKVLERSAGHATGAYHFPAVDVEAVAVYTNNLPCGAMRGFGVNQATFGLESLVDDLCEQGGFDRWQFRYDNALTDGAMTSTGQVLASGVGVRATLEAVKEQFHAARFAGIACGIKNTGIGNGMPDSSFVRIRIEGPERVVVEHGWTEMGQGVHTMAVQMLCEATGLPPGIVAIRVDTEAELVTGMTTASRATSLVGNAILAAAEALRRDLETQTLADLVGRAYEGGWTVDWTTKPGAKVEQVHTHYSYSYATQLVTLDERGRIERVIAAHDAGRIVNPTLFEGQLEGSIHMGLGYALSEDLPQEGGYLTHTMLRKCGILRAKEMPEMEIIGIEVPDPHGPLGVKGVGEIGLVPTAAAVANALRQFDGVRRTELPMRLPRAQRIPARKG